MREYLWAMVVSRLHFSFGLPHCKNECLIRMSKESQSLTEVLAQLSAEVDRLALMTYCDEVKKGVETVLNACPDPAKCNNAQEKIQTFLVRGRAQLLLPAFIKEAETDLNKALKLDQANVATWVALSEAYWRRNALKEAHDACESALRLDAKSVAALNQLSRIIRCECGASDSLTAEQKAELLAESVAKAKEAVGIDTTNGESWLVLALALLQECMFNGMDMPTAKKALSAFNQAATRVTGNPDVFYNRGVVLKMFGEYAKAADDFDKAYGMDPKGLPGARHDAQSCRAIITRAAQLQATKFAGLNERDFKKNVASRLASQPSKEGMKFFPLREVLDKPTGAKEARWCAVKAMEMLGTQTSQPLVYQCIDKDGTQCVILLYRVKPDGLKPNDTLWIPFPPSTVSISSAEITVDQTDADGKPTGEKKTFKADIPIVVLEPSTVFVNGGLIPNKNFTKPQMSSRLFQ